MIYPVYSTIHPLNNWDLLDSSMHPLNNWGMDSVIQRVDSAILGITRLRWFPHNIRAIMTKIKLPKKPLSMVIVWIKVRRSCRDLSSQADPARENWTWSYPYFSLNWCFALVENTITLAFSSLTKFDIKFLKNAWGFHRRVT